MNKKILVVACLVIMTTVFTGCDLLGGDKNKEGAKDSKTESNVEQNKESGVNGSGDYFEAMTDLMERGKSMKCTYTQKVDDENTADGVVYMADGNARIEITANKGTANEGKMYAIIDEGYHYSWVEGSSKGYKMTAEAAEMDEKMKKGVSKMAEKIKYKCSSWKKDSSKFKAPSNIVFEDLSEMMKGFEGIDFEEEAKKAEAQANKFICEHCKNAPASEQAECLGDVVCDWSE